MKQVESDVNDPTTPNPTPRRGRPLRGRRVAAWSALLAVGALVAAIPGPALAQSRVGPSPLGNAAAPLPAEVEAVEIEQKLGNTLPLDASFVDQHGNPVKLGDYFRGDKPVVIEFAYFECPLLCPMVMNGIIEATRRVNGVTFDARGEAVNPTAAGDWVPGQHFEIVTISINPDDTPVSALEEQAKIAERFMADGEQTPLSEGVRDGWHFLTGREVDIKRVADAAGFGYAAVPATSDYAHGAVLTFASPDGVVTRYLPGHVYPERDFRMALTEASQGKQGSVFDMILQLCYHYDSTRGVYTPTYMSFMKIGGAVTVLTLGSLIGGMLLFEKRRKHRLTPAPPPE